MDINILEILSGTKQQIDVNFNKILDNSDFLNQDIRLKEPVNFTGKIYKEKEDLVILEGSLEVTIEADCARCLESVEDFKSIAIKDKFTTSEDVAQKESNEEHEVYVLQGNTIDLEGVIKDYIFSNLPIRYLCNENCKGLCSKCGKNLNKGSCNCVEDVDPRFAKLKELLDNKEV